MSQQLCLLETIKVTLIADFYSAIYFFYVWSTLSTRGSKLCKAELNVEMYPKQQLPRAQGGSRNHLHLHNSWF